MQFALFVLLNAVLFLRPGDLVPGLEAWPIYLGLLLLAWLSALPLLLDSNRVAQMLQHPSTWCVIGVEVAIVLSHLGHGRTFEARERGFDFAKILLYYCLLLLVLDTPQRLRRFLVWLLLLIVILTGLAVLQFFNLVQLASQSTLFEQRIFDPQSGEYIITPRLCAIGLFHDPNDLCLILVIGMVLGCWRLRCDRGLLLRLFWLAILTLFALALVLSQSRGGLLAVLAAAGTYLWMRWGWHRTAIVGLIALPALLMLLSGRMANLGTEEETAQARVNLWSEGMLLFRQNPMIGIGAGLYDEEVGQVAHNSFVHCFAELGLLGGTCFLGAIVLCIWSLYLIAVSQPEAAFLEYRTQALDLLCIVVGYSVGMFSLSRSYIAPTYLVLGLGVVASQQAWQAGTECRIEFSGKLVGALAAVSVLFLIGINLFIRVALSRMS